MPRGFPNRILAGPDSRANNITSLAFENCTIGGVDVVSHFCACIGSPCLRQCVHGAPIGDAAEDGRSGVQRDVGERGPDHGGRAEGRASGSRWRQRVRQGAAGGVWRHLRRGGGRASRAAATSSTCCGGRGDR
eukprot:COSAG01_NODE_3590_length_5899_cov_70.093793_5_plen_133_part_00